jgi:hypothetical protein
MIDCWLKNNLNQDNIPQLKHINVTVLFPSTTVSIAMKNLLPSASVYSWHYKKPTYITVQYWISAQASAEIQELKKKQQ